MLHLVPVPDTINKVVYSTGKAMESLPKLQYHSTITVIPNTTYSILVDALRHQKTDSVEKLLIKHGKHYGINCFTYYDVLLKI